MIRTTRTIAALAGIACLTLTQAAMTAQTKPAPPTAAADTSAVTVTAKYAGKGTVDSTHRIWVWLFDTPDIGPGSIPIGEMSIEKNGGTATFPSVTTKEVYVAVAYDEKGGFLGQAPPPLGSPIAFYGVKAATDKPMAIVPGAKGKVTLTFTDTQRMK
jgi:hypothetical protein